MVEVVKKKKFKFLSFIFGSGFYIIGGLSVFTFIYMSSKSNQDIEQYQKYTKKVLAEIDRHELLKHQIAQGTLTIDKNKKPDDKTICNVAKTSKNNKDSKEKDKKCEDDLDKTDKDEIISTNVFRNDELIKLDNAVIKNDTYSIVTTFDFSKGHHLFSDSMQLCHLAKYLAPELKDSLFTKVKLGDYIVQKNTKSKELQTKVLNNCSKNESKITIETKFYPKDLSSAPIIVNNDTGLISNPTLTNTVSQNLPPTILKK